MDEVVPLLSEDLGLKLKLAMDWVIPPDSSPGAGTDRCLRHLLELLATLDPSVIQGYKTNLSTLTEESLADPSNHFSALLIDQVRDVYYAYADTGAWEDVGFEVTG